MKWMHLYLTLSSLFLLFISCLVVADDYQVTPADSWVKQHELLTPNIPNEHIKDGTFYLMLDTQFKVTEQAPQQRFTRTVMQAANQSGVDYISQLNIDFDPSYQSLSLNSLGIIRNGEYIDKLGSAQRQVLQRETDLASRIYNGTLSLNIIIDDMRVMDILDYSYTISGSNPVYQHFSTARTLNWSVPVVQQFMRVLWQKPTPLHINFVNGESTLISTPLNIGFDYQINQHNEPTMISASEVPYWYSPYKQVYFSEVNNWQEVIDWSLPLYQSAIEISPAIETITRQIKLQHTDLESQIVAALRFSQDEVRYLGLEMGTNSHRPTPASETLALRYGDCKDKTVLLISLLKALGVDAYPALVNTEETKRLASLPVAPNLFDHVIVTLEHQGKRYWLDPTTSYQRGDLAHLAQPNYGVALIVKEGETGFTDMLTKPLVKRVQVFDSYSIPEKVDDATHFTTRYEYGDFEAISRRSSIAKNSLKSTEDDYREYYQDSFKGLKTAKPMTVDTLDDTGQLITNEYYTIDNFWKPDNKGYRNDFYASEIQNSVYKPEQLERNAPMWFRYPNDIETTIQIAFSEPNWEFEEEQLSIDNPFFHLEKRVTFKDSILTLYFDYSAKQDHIPADQIEQYLNARKKLINETQYGIIKYGTNTATTTQVDEETNWYSVFILSYLAAIIFFIAAWRFEVRKRPEFEGTQFYPVSNSKFVIYSLLSLGIFINYWSYRNWKAIKEQQQSHIMPIARGIFAPLFFIPLLLELCKHSEQTFGKNKIMPVAVGFVLWLAIIISEVVSYNWEYGTWLFLVTPILWLPLVNYIQNLKQPEQALEYHSQWRARQVIISIFMLPWLFYGLIYELYLLPNSTIVTGDKLWSYQVNFLKRKEIIPANENVQYFYSDAFVDFKTDGNGITENTIFSYWENEHGVLEKDQRRFSDIKKLNVDYAKSALLTTTLTVIDHNGDEMLLFLSHEDDLDKKFVAEVERLIKANTPATEQNAD
ncbi:DUF3857 domain-containing transglutaminase family protein [Pseudoalteromonas sp. bablab_jr011]|uniref:DUF3857 domain-containing transglutaminase family protein n=1 Tax=Pseudoalteromonas sp. bablab_jr011 TaxID=2755062 RepID=UPI0018F2B1B3|nr:DUF3857 domain-containing transglutaminase family protein [Pseudoalteromonas sp. bablab_jr011]